jgi:hypothetical protein
MKIKAIRGFYYERKLIEEGDELEVGEAFGRELILNHKAIEAVEKVELVK